MPVRRTPVLNDVIQFSIAELLSRRAPHIGSFGVGIASDLGVSAAVVGMAAGAVVRPVCPTFFKHLRQVGQPTTIAAQFGLTLAKRVLIPELEKEDEPP
jgi:hypothetical protein